MQIYIDGREISAPHLQKKEADTLNQMAAINTSSCRQTWEM